MDYELRTSTRARHIKIKVEPPDKVIVVAPPRAPKHLIERFVHDSEDWIQRHLSKLEQRAPFGETKTTLTVFGKTYQKEVSLDKTRPIGVSVEGNTIRINPVQLTENSIQAEIKRFLKSTAAKYIVPRTKQLATTMSTSFGTVTLRAQKTRWGSCSSSGNLNFNWRLVHCPPPVIDYVIIHELAHRQQMNHSDKFWQIVAKFDPEHRIHRGWLKRHGMTLG